MLAGAMVFAEWILGPNDSPTHPFPYIYLWRIYCSPFLTATEKIDDNLAMTKKRDNESFLSDKEESKWFEQGKGKYYDIKDTIMRSKVKWWHKSHN